MHVCTVRLAGQDQQTLRGGEFRVWRLEELPLYLQFSGHSNVMLLYDDSTVRVPREPSLPRGEGTCAQTARFVGTVRR